jgi:hypothetical protein
MPLLGESAHRDTAHRFLYRLLMAFGLACLAFYAFFTLHSALYQRQAKAEIDRMIAARNAESASRPESPTMSRRTTPAATCAPGARHGDRPRRCARLKLSAAIAEGDDDSTLEKAVGHPTHRCRGNRQETRRLPRIATDCSGRCGTSA